MSKGEKELNDESILRADALRNRERILAAAEEIFLTKGAAVSLEDVAKRAGVGIGTLYRRFPTREALLAAACSERFLSLAETSRVRDAEVDAGSAVRLYLEELVTNTTLYRSLAASLGTVLQSGTPGCHAITEEGQRLLHRGQEARILRRDVTFDDLVYVVTAISLAAEQDGSPPSRIAHLVNLFLVGISER